MSVQPDRTSYDVACLSFTEAVDLARYCANGVHASTHDERVAMRRLSEQVEEFDRSEIELRVALDQYEEERSDRRLSSLMLVTDNTRVARSSAKRAARKKNDAEA